MSYDEQMMMMMVMMMMMMMIGVCMTFFVGLAPILGHVLHFEVFITPYGVTNTKTVIITPSWLFLPHLGVNTTGVNTTF